MDEKDESDQYPDNFEKQKQWFLRIHANANPCPGFDAITIQLDGSLFSDLIWTQAIEHAHECIAQGFKILWKLDCGLFHSLWHPINHSSQFLSFTLAIEQFKNIIWPLFHKQTVGMVIYQGEADFSRGFDWTDEQKKNYEEWKNENQLDESLLNTQLFCRNVCIDYLHLLSSYLPEQLSAFLFLDGSNLSHPLQFLHPAIFERFQLGLKNFKIPFQAYGWQSSSAWGYCGHTAEKLMPLLPADCAICLPENLYLTTVYHEYEEVIEILQKNGVNIRLIAESHLTSEWNGLNDLIYHPKALSFQGKRKIQGFCAAGGLAISCAELMHFSQEMTLTDWLKEKSFLAKN